MKRDEIKAYLSSSNSLVELIGKSNQLKLAGEKESTVNRVVMEVRRSMVKASKSNTSYKVIPRNSLPTVSEESIGYIPFSVNNLSSPVILYDGMNILI